MAPEPHPAPERQAPAMTVTATDDQRVVLAFSGELDAHMARELEEWFLDPRLREAREWVLEMGGLRHMDLTCAYALLRAAATMPTTAAVRIRGARHSVQRTLRHAGADAVASFEG